MKLYPYQQHMLDAMTRMRREGRAVIVSYPRQFGRSLFQTLLVSSLPPVDNGIRPNMVIIDEVTNLTSPLPVKRVRCNNVLTRQKVLSTRRGRRAKRRNYRKG